MRLPTAAVRVNQEYDLAAGVRHLERVEEGLAVLLVREVIVELAPVDLDLARTRRHAHPRDRALAPTGPPDVVRLHLRCFRRLDRCSCFSHGLQFQFANPKSKIANRATSPASIPSAAGPDEDG